MVCSSLRLGIYRKGIRLVCRKGCNLLSSIVIRKVGPFKLAVRIYILRILNQKYNNIKIIIIILIIIIIIIIIRFMRIILMSFWGYISVWRLLSFTYFLYWHLFVQLFLLLGMTYFLAFKATIYQPCVVCYIKLTIIVCL